MSRVANTSNQYRCTAALRHAPACAPVCGFVIGFVESPSAPGGSVFNHFISFHVGVGGFGSALGFASHSVDFWAQSLCPVGSTNPQLSIRETGAGILEASKFCQIRILKLPDIHHCDCRNSKIQNPRTMTTCREPPISDSRLRPTPPDQTIAWVGEYSGCQVSSKDCFC